MAIHPEVQHLLQFFEFSHLPPELKIVAMPFRVVAFDVASNERLHGPELTVCLRKLLEAKDCAVRAALTPEAYTEKVSSANNWDDLK